MFWDWLSIDPEFQTILTALAANILSWCVSTFAPSFLDRLLPKCEQEEIITDALGSDDRTRCICIGRPGGLEQLRLITLKPGIATCGYNLQHAYPDNPFTTDIKKDLLPDCVVVRNCAFSINYADCCIRWGLYESANRYVGWPIVPGFDLAGVVEHVGKNVTEFKPGDKVFGVSLFGAYSTRVVVPALQLRPLPANLTFVEAASLPTVALTAIKALLLANQYPPDNGIRWNNRAILIHSAAGGVGSMMVQMSKILGCSPVVGVVGRTSKVETARALGCDVVIDKQEHPKWWDKVRDASPQGYATVMDANGISTLEQSYQNLAPTGRLIVFGFHSNLPMGRSMLSPREWLGMAWKKMAMPKFDAMDMVVKNKAVLGFNLSFLAQEIDAMSALFNQISRWIDEGKLSLPRIVEMDLTQVAQAHELIQSGQSVGKIVITTTNSPLARENER